MNNIYILNKNYKQIGVLSNQGANPQAPYYDDLYIQELDTGADTYQFSTISSKYTQDLLEIGNHVMFSFNNRNEIFTITSLEYSHYEGYKTIGVYAEGIGFELLEVFMERPPIKKYPNSGNDSDGDGDDNTDDEYADPDDIYIDENGNIIYDEDGSGPPSADDVYIDEDGFIIYKPDKKKEKNDSLEFKNISFPTFLKILLKNTGWNYTCQSGLSSVKHNINVRYDTNIYAVLQDSMQAYRGVELEFVHEMRNGKVQKIVKAYKDGGRGSVVGKRFEYGTNVKGITKTQEVTDSEDDTVLYVDDVGVKVYYDVDFALKSVEVPEIEIGDTHYVIDKDFYPPMTIKARIGKIEISFTDPTKNKIYLANNKNIRGSSDEEDIRDILDDYFNDKYGDEYGDGADHTHDRLVCNESNVEFIYEYDFQDSLYPELGLLDRSYSRIHMGDNSFLIQTMNRDDDVHWLQIEVFRLDPLATGCSNRGIMFTSLDDLIPNASGRLDIGSEDYRWRNLYVDNINGSPAGGIGSGEVDSITFSNGTSIVQASDGGISVEREDGDGTKLNVYGELYVTEKIKCELGMEANTLNIKTIQFSDGTSLTSANGLGNDGESPGSGIPEGVITYTQDPIPGNGYRLDFNADRTYVNDLLIANDGMSVIGDLNVTEKISGLEMEATILYIEGIQFSDGTTLTSANGSVSIVSASIDDSNHLIFTLSDGSTIDAGELSCDGNPGGGELPSDVFEVKDGELHIKLPINFEESANFIKCGLTGGSDLTGVMILGAEILEGCRIIKASEGKLRIEGDLVVTGNITSNNSVSAATISDDNLEYYQEELRIRDEKIASLEARLAKIEEMLGINNN